MDVTKRLWIYLGTLLVLSFSALLWTGSEIYREAPPMPEKVLSESGSIIYTLEDIQKGRQVWQSFGGMQLGSIWGHGSYVAPDWSADWLHREAIALLNIWAKSSGDNLNYAQLSEENQAKLQGRLQSRIRLNTFNEKTKIITFDKDRARAILKVQAHFQKLFGDESSTASLRESYAMRNNTVPNAANRHALTAFFWWTSWATVTNRPGSQISYTNNWPSEPLVGNKPPASTFVWSAFSVIFLIAGIALLGWHHAISQHHSREQLVLPINDPLRSIVVTPSMRATAKYFWLLLSLFLIQILLGSITAHYQIEGQQQYGFNLSEILPYALTRTWHTQLAVLWIATAWLATGLYIAPAISGYEPKYQRMGVNFLWISLIAIVIGSFTGQWFAVMQKMGLKYNFWFGHQGWEYSDMGRFWQWYLFVGLILWLVLIARSLWPVLRVKSESRSIVALLMLSTIAIGLFYGAALISNEHSHISTIEYWRWWLVHLWVEGFFEVFATAVLAIIFTRLGLLPTKTATVAVLFATIIFMAGGVLGTLHHLYFSGTPMAVLALGASFSALEVVPLAYIGFEAYHYYQLGHATAWMQRYRWPIMFFLAVSFWNIVGAGLLGFLVNPPLSLYYMQGLNLTPLHGHAALFGVYGMLGIGLVLYCIRGIKPDLIWNEKMLKVSFWSLNIGLALMAILTLLPIGTLQLLAAIDHGYWYARSADFMQKPIIDTLVWMRVPGDIIFSIGALSLCWFILELWLNPKTEEDSSKQNVGEIN